MAKGVSNRSIDKNIFNAIYANVTSVLSKQNCRHFNTFYDDKLYFSRIFSTLCNIWPPIYCYAMTIWCDSFCTDCESSATLELVESICNGLTQRCDALKFHFNSIKIQFSLSMSIFVLRSTLFRWGSLLL